MHFLRDKTWAHSNKKKSFYCSKISMQNFWLMKLFDFFFEATSAQLMQVREKTK